MSDQPQQPIEIDLSPLEEIAGGDNMFVMALLGKMSKALPVAFTNMRTAMDEQDYETLRAASHKAKSTFAYLGLDEMKGMLKDIETDSRERTHLEALPDKVTESIALGERILAALKMEMAKLM